MIAKNPVQQVLILLVVTHNEFMDAEEVDFVFFMSLENPGVCMLIVISVFYLQVNHDKRYKKSTSKHKY